MSLPPLARISRLASSPSSFRRHACRLDRRYSQHRTARAAAAFPLPTVQSCPSPTCACAETPAMPEGLEIDRKGKLNGLIANYSEQVLVCTGKDDWPSRIEEDNDGDNLAADLKELFGRGGAYSDPFHHISILNASLPSSALPPRARAQRGLQTTSAYLLPSFKYVPFLPRVSFESVQALAKGFLLPERLHAAHDGALSPAHRDRLTRRVEYQRLLPGGVRDVRDVLVLVCGHGGRDGRCGVMGPVLRGEFERALPRAGVEVLRGPVVVEDAELDADADADAGSTSSLPAGETPGREGGETSSGHDKPTARVGLVSHVGGHKFAGNVIIYLPPSMRVTTPDGKEGRHPLAGCGIWYGRVEPRHVEGIVAETVLRGNVIAELFRGGITREREIVRL